MLRIPLFGILLWSASSCSLALGSSYHFAGTFQPLTRRPLFGNSYTPTELIGASFEIIIDWPQVADAYSSDSQPGAEYWGAYRSEEVSFQISVAGFDFYVPPTISSWSSWNDAVLDYVAGIPLVTGDQVQLGTRANWRRLIEFPALILPDGLLGSPEGTIEINAEYYVRFRAVDYEGTVLDDDSLQLEFDLSAYDELWFEFIEAVPVSSQSQQLQSIWEGTITSFHIVPEPPVWALVLSFLALSKHIGAGGSGWLNIRVTSFQSNPSRGQESS